jgi:hypothetical protein
MSGPHHYRPGFTAHLRKFGIGRAEYRKAKTTLAALRALEAPVQAAMPDGCLLSLGDVVQVLSDMVHGEHEEYP